LLSRKVCAWPLRACNEAAVRSHVLTLFVRCCIVRLNLSILLAMLGLVCSTSKIMLTLTPWMRIYSPVEAWPQRVDGDNTYKSNNTHSYLKPTIPHSSHPLPPQAIPQPPTPSPTTPQQHPTMTQVSLQRPTSKPGTPSPCLPLQIIERRPPQALPIWFAQYIHRACPAEVSRNRKSRIPVVNSPPQVGQELLLEHSLHRTIFTCRRDDEVFVVQG